MNRRTDADATEVFDSGLSRDARAAELDDIERLNAWFRGYALTLRHIGRVVARRPQAGGLVVIDVGGGRGDFAKRLVGWARRRDRAIQVIVVDTATDLLEAARALSVAYPEISAVRADVRQLPVRSGVADVVTASLLLHHLEPEAVTTSLAEMARAARRAVVVNDLLRSRISVALTWLATRLFARTWMARRDGPRAVARAYSPLELRRLAAQAGIAGLRIRRYPLWARLVATWP